MEVEDQAIVLKTTKYQDKNLIVKVYSLQNGLMSFFVQNAFSTAKKSGKSAYFQPLNIIDFQLFKHKMGALPKLKVVNNHVLLQDIYIQVEKSAILLFLSEIINLCIKEEEQNQKMFFFLKDQILALENTYHSNFHLNFLLEFSAYLGFFPKTDYQINDYFDKQNGCFTSNYNPNCFTRNQSGILHIFFENPLQKITSSQKKDTINLLLEYYQVHIHSSLKLKSLEVLKEVFN